MARFEGKVALITGGASGIGRAAALSLSGEGAKVVLADLQEAPGEEVVREMMTSGGDGRFVHVDVSQAADVKRMVDLSLETYGKLDIAINNAGIEGSFAPLAESSEEHFDRVIAVNLKGVYLGMKYEIPAMLKQGTGTIVNVSSVAGLVGFPEISAYTASKHGIIGLTKAAALEYARLGIRINSIAPGVIRTPMVERVATTPEALSRFAALEPMARLGKPEEVADAILYLASDKATFVTGTTLVVDGGFIAQ